MFMRLNDKQDTPLKAGSLGSFLLFLGVLPYTGKTLEMLKMAKAKHAEGKRVYVSGINSYVHSKPKEVEGLVASLDRPIDFTRHTDCLSSDHFVDKILQDKPDILVVGRLIPADPVDMEARELRIQKLLDAGVDVYASLNVYQVENAIDQLPYSVYSKPKNVVPLRLVLAASEIKVVDTSTFQALKILKETPIVKQYSFVGNNIKYFVKEENLEALRQAALSIAVDHSKESQALHELEQNYTHEAVESFKEATKVPYLKTFMYDNLIALMVVVLCTLVNSFVAHSVFFDIQVKTLIYLTGVVAITLFTNIYTGILGVVLTYLTYNFFFIPPIYKISVYNFPDVATALVFGFCAVLINIMTHTSFKKMQKSRRLRDLESNISADFLKETVRLQSVDQIMKVLASTIEGRLNQKVGIVYLKEDSTTLQHIGEPISQTDFEIIKPLLAEGKNKQQNVDGALKKYMLPIQTYNGIWGVVVFKGHFVSHLQNYKFVVESICQIAGRGVERIFLGDIVQETLIDNERERYRSALLSSISHDLKTPLVGIIGALSTLKSYRDKISQEDADDLLSGAISESQRLNQFISNILEISKIEAGHLNLKKNWVNVHEVCHGAAGRFKMCEHAGISVLTDDAYDIYIDPVLFEQVLFNLIDNAIKYAGSDKPVEIVSEKSLKALKLRVQDFGKGIDENCVDRYFDKFYRHNLKDNVNAGTGLGLAICKGSLQAHGFDINVYNRQDKHTGAVFEIIIPKEHIQHART